MTKKQVLKLILVYAVLFLVGTFAYIASFHTFILSFLNVFFYRGIALIVLWGIIISVLMLIIKKKWMNDTIIYRDIILLFMCFCCINVVIFTHLPVTADRSVTVYMLGYMNNHADETFRKEDLEQQFIDQYVIEYEAFEKRFEEQIVSGNIIEVAPGEYQITDGGQLLMDIYSVTVQWYNLDDKLVNPQ
ncbi:MAG: hypothetical protein MJ094_09430 [Saccharofermentans sp.]|nr:hypothetical protein [Saccharofermentans sp.]